MWHVVAGTSKSTVRSQWHLLNHRQRAAVAEATPPQRDALIWLLAGVPMTLSLVLGLTLPLWSGHREARVARFRVSDAGFYAAVGNHPTSTLADLYDPLTIPAPLLKAHQELDRAVDRCYRPEPFTSDRQRVEFLFTLYEKLTAPLVAAAKPKRVRRKPSPYAEPPPAPVHPSLNPEQAYGDAAHYYSAKEEPPPYHAS